MQDIIHALALFGFVGSLLVAAATDAAKMTIPNGLITLLLLGYALVAVILPVPLGEVLSSLATASAILLGGMLLFSLGWMGGGDVKLLSVSGLWLGAAATPALLILAALAGGLLSLALLAHRAHGAHRFAASHIAALRDQKGPVPYGIAIATAGIAVALMRPGALLSG